MGKNDIITMLMEMSVFEPEVEWGKKNMHEEKMALKDWPKEEC